MIWSRLHTAASQTLPVCLQFKQCKKYFKLYLTNGIATPIKNCCMQYLHYRCAMLKLFII